MKCVQSTETCKGTTVHMALVVMFNKKYSDKLSVLTENEKNESKYL